jgi:c-di-GMP-binding flagellar brake protein YcgR
MKEEMESSNLETSSNAQNEISLEVNELLQAKIPEDKASYFSRVNDILENKIIIAWPTSRGIRMALRPTQIIELAFVRAGKAYAFNGYILEASPDPLPQITVRPNSEIRKIQRRQNFRVKCLMPIQITGTLSNATVQSGDKSPAIFVKTVTYDLSAGGISIRHSTRIPEDTLIEVKLGLPDGGPDIKAPARVAYSTGLTANASMYHTGVDFLAISEWEQARIIRCLYRLQLKSVRD